MDTASLEVMPVSTPAVPLSAIRQPALLYDASRRICAANDLAEALAGRPLVGLSPADLIRIFRVTRPDGTALPAEELPGVRAQAGHEAVEIPVAITVADGRTLDILATASPIWEDGAITGALVVWQTVTERRQAETALRRSERRFQTLFEAMQEGITLVEVCRDEHGEIVDCVYREVNPQAVRRMGVASPEEVIGRSVGELYGRAVLDRYLPYVREAMASGEPVRFTLTSTVDAENREYLTSYVPVDTDGLMALTLDITEIVRARTEAEEERARLQGVLEAAPVGIFIGDEHGRGVLMNEAFSRIWGGNAPMPGSVEEYRDYRGRFTGTGAEIRLEDWPGTRSLAGEACSIVADIARFDGKQATAIISAVPLRGPDGTGAGNVVVLQDITERRRAEELLAASEEKYRRLFETMTEGFLLVEPVLDDQGVPVSYRYLDANPALERLTHLKREEIVGRDVRDVLPGAEPYWIETFGRVALTGEPAQIEQFSQDLGGWYNVYVYSPAPGTAALVYTNITARKETERALAGQRELLERLVETVPVMISIYDPALGSFHLNRAVGEVAGWTDADAADGRLLERIYPDPAYRAEVEEYMRSLEPGFRDLTMTAKDGSTVPASWANFRLSNEVQVGVGIDLSERARAEAALRESEERFRVAVDNFPHVYVLYDPDLRIRFVNRAGIAKSGYALDEIVGRTDDELFPPEVTETYLPQLRRALETRTRHTFESTHTLPSGTTTSIVDYVPLLDGRGAVRQILGITTDITERKRNEEALRRSNEELQRFAYVASHDLQEPLRSIVSFSQLLERRYKGRLDQDANEYIGFIVEGGTRMQRLIADLLQVSRVETAAKPPESTDAAAVVGDVLRSMDTTLREVGATVTVGDLPTVMADPGQLGLVILNLVGNALKYRREDVPPVVAVSARRLDGLVEFAVQDNGIGIEPEYFDRIFEMFQRLHTHDQYEGTGIGLAVVKRIVDRHGGSVRVESTPGEGSTFYFTLPAA